MWLARATSDTNLLGSIDTQQVGAIIIPPSPKLAILHIEANTSNKDPLICDKLAVFNPQVSPPTKNHVVNSGSFIPAVITRRVIKYAVGYYAILACIAE